MVTSNEQNREEQPMETAFSPLTSEAEAFCHRDMQTEKTSMINCSTQTKCDIEGDVESLLEKNKVLAKKVFGVRIIKGNDVATKVFTGLPSWAMFLHVFMFLSPFVTPSKVVKLDDEFFSVLVRRLNLFITDLSSRLGVSNGTVFNIFQKWLDAMFVRLQFLITWPSREVMQNNMPLVFQQLHPRCRIIIDCSEIFIETPSSFDARSKTYSNYKKHNTVKFLIGVTP